MNFSSKNSLPKQSDNHVICLRKIAKEDELEELLKELNDPEPFTPVEERKWQTQFAYGFPFPPYEIQLRLMEQIEKTIHFGNIGLFSSPTGTGKSLSIVCGTLYWLLQERERISLKINNKLKQLQQRLDELKLQSLNPKIGLSFKVKRCS